MDLNWLESFLYGLFSGLADILPVSAEAHRILMLKCFGIQSSTELMKLFAHLGVFGAMYFSCRKQINDLRQRQALRQIFSPFHSITRRHSMLAFRIPFRLRQYIPVR